ncbi:hypothetical protein [Poritiphilus flavus]|uniref:Lipoprotein n=1 Tax=Poritiphilus flavus TaxID=2697053 RepID=A0A6L9EFP9_9FLAO|nr:hypothetical protein [Poritiphilus flavus]NAS13600.1 hypothetical protein [Poritiphilus flavus]
MNTKKFLAGICTCLILMAASCTTDTADDQAYEQGVDRSKITIKNVDRSKITVKNAVDRSKVRSSNKKGK